VPLQVWSGVAQVVASLPGPGRLDLYAIKQAGAETPILLVEAYDAESLVTAGTVTVWELNQAIAALLSTTTQARRIALRDDGRAHAGHLDVVAEEERVDVVASSDGGGTQVAFATTTGAFVRDLNALVRHYLALTRANVAARTIVLPDALAPQRASTAASTVS
jgi:hypothetical protein